MERGEVTRPERPLPRELGPTTPEQLALRALVDQLDARCGLWRRESTPEPSETVEQSV